MNVITSKISIDLLRPTEPPVVHAVQGECNTRDVQVAVFCDGTPWQIPEGTFLAVRYGRVTQTGGYYDTLPDGSCAYRYEGNTVTVMLAPQMMATAGTVTAQVEMSYGDQVLVTFSFKVVVAVNPAVGVTGPESYINWKQWLEQELDKYLEKVNQSGQLLGGTMAGPINMNGNVITGLPAPEANDQAVNRGYLHHCLRKKTVKNLLDNSDFTNPVNQRELSVYSEGYTIDRWQFWDNASGGKLSVTGRGVQITVGAQGEAALIQTLPDDVLSPGKIYTLALYLSNGDVHVEQRTFAGNEVRCSFRDAVEIASIGLYEGEYTIETIPDYQPKGYAAEYMECIRYFYRLGTPIMLYATNTDWLAGNFVYPVKMRLYPTVTDIEITPINDISNNVVNENTVVYVTDFGITSVNSPGSFVEGQYYFLKARLSADV